MKTNLGRILLAACLCGTVPALAEPANQLSNRERDAFNQSDTRLGTLERANKVLGMDVKDSQNQKIGKVKDLAVDLENGRIVLVIVSSGGILGVDAKYVAVPPSQFSLSANNWSLVLNADAAHFKDDPGFKLDQWNTVVQLEGVANLYKSYNTRPYFVTADIPSQNRTVENQSIKPIHYGQIERLTDVLGMTAQNMQSEKLGKIENLVVDLPAGRVVEVIIASGGFLGIDQEFSAVPPQSFRAGTDRKVLLLDTSKESLASAPHFSTADWTSANNPDAVAKVYSNYKVEPYFGVDNTRQNVRDRRDDALTPLKQGSSASDVDMTRQIRKQLISTDGLSVYARNVKVITIDGHVTLRGPVKTAEEKRQVADLAARVTASANIDNQLEVRGTTTTTSSDK